MADDINKKITIDVEVNSDGQQQVNLYKAAFDALRNSINGLSNPLSALSGSISALDKDISRLTGSVNELNKKNADFSSAGDKVQSKVKDLASSFTTWNKVIEILEVTTKGWINALSGGLAVLITFAPEILKWISGMLQGNTTLTALNKTLKDNKIVTDAVNQARAQGRDDAQQELTQLKLLYKASQDNNLSITERKKIVAELQSRFPDYFGNMSAETILTGKAAKNYNELTKAIIATARAKAAEEIITKNQVRQLGNDNKLDKLKSDLAQYTKQLKAAQIEYDKYTSHPAIGGGTFATGDTEEAGLYQNLARVRDLANETQKTIGNLNTDSDLLTRQNEALAKTIIDDTEKNGASVLGIAAKTTDRIRGSLKDKQLIFTEAEKIQRDSLTRQLQVTYEAYGKETLAENNHYQDELKKLKDLYDKKLITKKQYELVSRQLDDEHNSNLPAIMNKYNEQDKQRTEQAQNELTELKIKAMKDGAAKQIAELELQQTQQNEQLDKAEQESVTRVKQLYKEIADAKNANPSADTAQLQNQLNTEFAAQEINCNKRIILEKQTADAIKKIKDQEAQDAIIKNHQNSVDAANNPEAKLAADKKMITDKYQFDIQQANGNATAIEEIHIELNAALKKLQDDYQKKKDDDAKNHRKKIKDEVLKDTKEIADEALSLISNNIKQQSDAKVAALEKNKTAELSNASLTSSQKLAIEQKYKQQEGKIKAKAFKEEQEASIAQAVINGAVAISKVWAQGGLLGALEVGVIIAETAAQVAKIASQKPPAYARGGLHYSSDGRGGVLPGYSQTDNTNAYLRSGEGVVVSEAMQVPWARNLVSAINVGFGGRDFSITNPGRGYAVGGIFTDGGDANRYYNQPVTDQKNLANTIAYQMINNFPPVYVDVKDINNQQNILAQTINRVNL